MHDGHQFVFGRQSFPSLPVFLEHIGDRPVVRRSNVAAIHPGDSIVELNGRPIAEVYQEELARTSAATIGYKLDIADRYIYEMDGPMTLELEDADGVQRTVTVEPAPESDYFDVINRHVSDRPSGPLTDLGAPDLYYLNMNSFITPDTGAANAAIAAAEGFAGLVLDMRGYPTSDHYEVAARLIQAPFTSPIFDWNAFLGPDGKTHAGLQYRFFPLPQPAFTGPIVLLTGPHAVSAAENFMQMLVGAGRLSAIVGQRSAGTNGNITYLSLPGGFFFTYTGMEVRNPDGSRFHGIGIVPDVEVPLTPADLRDGIDRDLLTAISVF
jgi:C-terminal processing protease CtpA/Prc